MDLKGKTVVCLGSSVTLGAEGISFADFMANECGCILIKEAVSGTTIADINSDSYVARLKRLDSSISVDLFICQLSTNDVYKVDDLRQTEEGIRYILTYIDNTFHCPCIFFTNPRFENERYNDLVILLEQLKKEYTFFVLDFWNDPQMVLTDNRIYKKYMLDSVHPTIAGYRDWWTPKFINYCKSLQLNSGV